jgi:hypothetical protein
MPGGLWLFFLCATMATIAGTLNAAFKLEKLSGIKSGAVIWKARTELVLAIACLTLSILGLWEHK